MQRNLLGHRNYKMDTKLKAQVYNYQHSYMDPYREALNFKPLIAAKVLPSAVFREARTSTGLRTSAWPPVGPCGVCPAIFCEVSRVWG